MSCLMLIERPKMTEAHRCLDDGGGVVFVVECCPLVHLTRSMTTSVNQSNRRAPTTHKKKRGGELSTDSLLVKCTSSEVLVFSPSDLALLLVQDARLFSTLITGKCGLNRPQPGPLRTHLCVYRSSKYVCLCGCIDGSPVQRKEREREMDRTQSANSCRT